MKYYLIAGEPSGDLHGSNLMKSLKKNDSEAEFRFFGGDKMLTQSPNLAKHYREMAFMGFVEVAMNMRTISKNMVFCKQDIIDFQPDVIILIDYAGFNLRIAKFAKENGIKTFYYISPKIWAWKESRIKKIKAYVDKLFVILPFEVEYFKTHNYSVDFEGNPLTDSIAQFLETRTERSQFLQENNLEDKRIIAVLPGSRKQEIQKMLPIMLQITNHFQDVQFVIAGTTALEKSYYQKYLGDSQIPVLFDKTYNILSHAHTAVVTSGTATLETALFNVPQVICYKTSALTYVIGKSFVKIKFFGLVNLIMDKEVVKELLQFNLVKLIKEELNSLIYNEKYRSDIKNHYNNLQTMLGGEGASERFAKKMIGYLQSKNE